MENKIALPDSYASYESLKDILDKQGYSIYKTPKVAGLTAQDVRLIDVVLIAPFLIYVSLRKELPNPIRITLFGLGVATLLYNGYNYIKNKE
jgi:hypothetical protein